MLDQILNRVTTIDLRIIVKRVLARHRDELLTLQKTRLSEGRRVVGPPLGGYKSKSHISLRRKLGKQVDHIDLNLSGTHYEDMYVKVGLDNVEFGSRDFKSTILEYIYGMGIYGITEEDIESLLFTKGWALEMAEEFNNEIFT